MNAMPPDQQALSAAIAHAVRQAVQKLFEGHSEDFYCIALITTGEAHAPVLSAWSREALVAETQRQGLASDDFLKWSYADSPYAFFGEECLEDVNRLFAQRPAMDHTLSDAAWGGGVRFRMSAMEATVKRLDEQGVFGAPPARNTRVVTVEVVPPDRKNTQRALRLDPSAALVDWLSEAAET